MIIRSPHQIHFTFHKDGEYVLLTGFGFEDKADLADRWTTFDEWPGVAGSGFLVEHVEDGRIVASKGIDPEILKDITGHPVATHVERGRRFNAELRSVIEFRRLNNRPEY